MNRTLPTATRPQVALQSYLDSLLQEAVIELDSGSELADFEAAVLEEQLRDAERLLESVPAVSTPLIRPVELSLVTVAEEPPVETPMPAPAASEYLAAAEQAPALEAPLIDFNLNNEVPASLTVDWDERPQWAEEPFECLLFEVGGLTLAVPLVCLGSIYPLAGHELTPLFAQPDWFLGLLPCQAGNLRVLDTARWVMPERYRDELRETLQYVISIQGFEWGLAVHQVSRSIRLDPDQVKWRSQRAQRPWLAGTVIEHMCALLDVAALAKLIESGNAQRALVGNG
ncbi:CheW domain-containing protein [Pseudomonas sp. MS19]|uniref:CheW domain-containing protein n=1 Tax=Pseudomonas sp. MS19 TaxID=2579939 RepID=UPI0015626175|nr:CheW domain-containing protein [Pseudomonas sp. MS19]NRH26679.1 chemotaxis protein CheW [Pseudomonas sp. MS19]